MDMETQQRQRWYFPPEDVKTAPISTCPMLATIRCVSLRHVIILLPPSNSPPGAARLDLSSTARSRWFHARTGQPGTEQAPSQSRARQ
jgi:hypothetical protein